MALTLEQNKGSLVIEREAGAELVTNGSNGQSAVMNMEQLQNAITRSIATALATMSGELSFAKV